MARLEPPVGSTAWSPDFVAQTLELLVVFGHGGEIRSLRPVHADALRVGWAVGRSADEILSELLARYGLTPRVLHSTSWRHDNGHVLLTYLAVVDAPADPGPHLVDEPVSRTELARGDATAAPASIRTAQVLEHALRHLAWLVADDPAIAAALPEWRQLLEPYVPEPFRGL
ncbi:MAG: hypothetical protein FIA92_06025 [Chloroflexi bacterium]|nr:hypothetical protein [Chloroflexota bacterium]